jgi:serine/threonine protein kinase
LGPYEILALIGAGGMGEVYQARDSRLNRLVALKVLPPDRVVNPERRQRFVQEAQLASSLEHPNIVIIYDIGTSDSVDYIAMELVRGRTVEALIPRRGMPLNQTLKIAVQVADALTAAHAAGVVHRDLKPGNIMVTDAEVVKVLDFGLAKLTETAHASQSDETRTQRASVQTEEGAILGSVAYMSPEQAEGRDVDARSDIFSFGAILYEMLTGQRAFAGASKMSTLAEVLKSQPKPLAELAPGLPGEVERLVMRCLRKNVDRRPQHMTDLKLELEGLLEVSESGSLQALPTSKGQAPSRLGWIAGAGALALTGAGLVWLLFPKSEVPLEPAPLTTLAGSESSPDFSPDGSQVAFQWTAENQLTNVYIQLISGGPPLRLTNDEGYHGSPAWSPDGRWIAYYANHPGGRRGIFEVPVLGGPERLLLESASPLRPAWSPDGKWLALSLSEAFTDMVSGIMLLSVESGDRREMEKLSPALLGSRSGAFSPDGRRLAYGTFPAGTNSGTIWTIALSPDMKPQGQPTQVTHSKVGAQFPVWTPDGREIVCLDGNPQSSGAISRVAANGKGAIRRIPGLGYTNGPMAFSRTGRFAYAHGGIDTDIWRFDLKGGGKPLAWASSTAFDAAAEYSPDGQRIAFSSNRSGAREIWASDAAGANAIQLTHFGGPVAGVPRWSPDGRWLAFDARPDGNANIFVVGSEGSGLRRLTNSSSEDARPNWSSDGRTVFFSSNRAGGAPRIWRVPADGGDPVQVSKQAGYGLRTSPDGEWIYYTAGAAAGELRRMHPDGSGDSLVLSLPVFPLAYTVMPSGVYAVVQRAASQPYPSVQFLSAAGRVSEVLNPGFAPHALGLSVTPDERYLLLTHPDDKGTDLMLVEHFR